MPENDQRFTESMEIDWEEFPDAPPDDWYLCRVSRVRRKDNQAGIPMAVTTFTVIKGKFEGTAITNRFSMPTEDAEKRQAYANILKPFLKAIGALGGRLDPNDSEGEELWVRTAKREWDGREIADVKGYRAADDPPAEKA